MQASGTNPHESLDSSSKSGRRKWVLGILILVVLTLVAVAMSAGSASKSSTSDTHTRVLPKMGFSLMKGKKGSGVATSDGYTTTSQSCSGTANFSAMHEGAIVTIFDMTGKELGHVALGPGVLGDNGCTFTTIKTLKVATANSYLIQYPAGPTNGIPFDASAIDKAASQNLPLMGMGNDSP